MIIAMQNIILLSFCSYHLYPKLYTQLYTCIVHFVWLYYSDCGCSEWTSTPYFFVSKVFVVNCLRMPLNLFVVSLDACNSWLMLLV